jgi:hypothetical protein
MLNELFKKYCTDLHNNTELYNACSELIALYTEYINELSSDTDKPTYIEKIEDNLKYIIHLKGFISEDLSECSKLENDSDKIPRKFSKRKQQEFKIARLEKLGTIEELQESDTPPPVTEGGKSRKKRKYKRRYTKRKKYYLHPEHFP